MLTPGVVAKVDVANIEISNNKLKARVKIGATDSCLVEVSLLRESTKAVLNSERTLTISKRTAVIWVYLLKIETECLDDLNFSC